MSKFPRSAGRISAEGIAKVIDPGVIATGDLLRVHAKEYVESIVTGEYNALTQLRLGLPWSHELARRSFAATAGTLCAARTALREGLSANLAGGTHHAFPDRGEGFCVFNDIAVAIRVLQADEPYMHAMVVDLDAHQGNGTHFIFRDDPHVYTYSVHVGQNYPSRKEPGSRDVELSRFADAGEYFTKLLQSLPGDIERFEPDLVFFIAGVDVHENDRFGQMKLTTEEMAQRDRFTIDLCRRWGIPVCVTYGGGYNRDVEMTADLHVQTIQIAAERLAAEEARKPSGNHVSI